MDAPNLPEYRPVYRALHRPLTVCGVDRRLFFLSLLVGAATFNLFYSFVAGCLLFSVLYAFALWSTKHDPQMLQILLRSGVSHARYDAAKPRPVAKGGQPMVKVARILKDHREAGASTSCCRSGALSTTARSSPRPARSASSIGSRAPTTSASITTNAAPSPSDSSARSGNSTSPFVSIST